MEEKKTDYNFSKRPLNYRPKPEQKEFIISLLEANAGSQQKALEHCVTLAMDPAKTITITKDAGNTEAFDRMKKEFDLVKIAQKEERAELHRLQEENRVLKAAPKPSGELKLDPNARFQVDKIRKFRKLGTDDEAIAYALNYTAKNDWL